MPTDLTRVHGYMATREIAGREITKREHWPPTGYETPAGELHRVGREHQCVHCLEYAAHLWDMASGVSLGHNRAARYADAAADARQQAAAIRASWTS